MFIKNRKGRFLSIFSALLLCGFTYITNVPTTVNDVDIVNIQNIIGQKIAKTRFQSFEEEVKVIRSIQENVINNIDSQAGGIPEGQNREPEDLYKLGHGLCYDKSRTIEKALSAYGFKVRHASIYKIQNNWFSTLIQRQAPSHAVTEVLTSKGWMLVDPNDRWIGIDKNDNPLSLADLKSTSHENICHDYPIHILCEPFIYIYGLYSRHGQFYPPFIPFPNINWEQMLYNVV